MDHWPSLWKLEEKNVISKSQNKRGFPLYRTSIEIQNGPEHFQIVDGLTPTKVPDLISAWLQQGVIDSFSKQHKRDAGGERSGLDIKISKHSEIDSCSRCPDKRFGEWFG